LPPEPPLTLVGNQSFDDGDLSNWLVGEGWSLIASEGGQALQAFNTTEAATLKDPTALNVVAQARFAFDAATTARLGVRQNETGGYVVTLDTAGQVTLLRAGAVFATAMTSPSNGESVQWRVLRLSAINGVVRVAVDGVEVIALPDDAPLPPGAVSLGAVYNDATVDHTLWVDDVSVWMPSDEVIAAPTATEPTLTPTASPTLPTQTPTPESVLTDSGEPRPISVIPVVQSVEASAAPPPNNSFSGALAATTLMYTYTGSTTDATLETGELGSGSNLPSCTYRLYTPTNVFYNYLTHTAWHRFTAPAAAEYNFSTAGSKFDTVLSIYTGSAVNALTQVACHDGYSGSNGTSNLNVTLAQNQTVYIQVGGFYGSNLGWFGAYTLQIKANVPLPTKATLLSPANAAYLDTRNPVLSWNAASDALNYDLEIDDQSNFSSPIYTAQDIAGTSHTVGTSLLPGTYYWRVRSANLNNQAPGWSSVWRFTVGILQSPLNGTIFTSTTGVKVAFRWYATAGATTYRLQIANDANFSSVVRDKIGLTSTYYTLASGEELGEGVYYWRVSPNGTSSPNIWRFTVSRAAPAAPSFTAPSDGFATNSTSVPVAWGAVPDALTYDIQLDDNSNFSSPTANVTGLTSPTYTFTSLSNALYYLRVRSVNNLGVPGRWSSVRRFTVDTVAPNAPALSAPTEGGASNSTTPTLSWRAVTGATRYQVQIDNDSNLASPLESVEVTTTSFRPTNPLNQGTWYWHVRTRDAAGNWSPWSEIRSFRVTIMSSPADKTVFLTTTTARPTFSWSRLLNATTYTLQIDDTPNFIAPLVRTYDLGSVTSFTLPTADALSHGVYYWRVNTNLGNSPVTRTFTVSPSTLAAPNILTPTQSQVTNDATPDITWSIVTGAIYDIQIDDSSSFTSPEANVTNLSAALYTFNSPRNALYYVRVRSVNNLGVAGSWSSVRRFTIDTVAPAAPELRAPVLGSFTSTLQPRFDWNTSSGANRYEFQVSLVSSFSAGASTQNYIVTNSDFTPVAPLLFRTYFWRVRALDAAGNQSAWTSAWMVTIVPATSIAPNLNRFVTSTPTLTWVPLNDVRAEFEIQVDNNKTFSSLDYQNNDIPGTAQNIVLPALSNGTWYWRIRVRDVNGYWSSWSPVQVFTIEAP
jgi:hypothetical protein